MHLAMQDLVAGADATSDPLPDSSCLHVSVGQPGIGEAARAGPPPSARGSSSNDGLMLRCTEWDGLHMQHTGSWQLSLLYTPQQLRCFAHVSWIYPSLSFVLQKHSLADCLARILPIRHTHTHHT